MLIHYFISDNSSNFVCEAEGFYGNPKNCTEFYRCVDNGQGGYNKFQFFCGDNTVWDQSIQSCNHPPAVGGKCGKIGSTPLHNQTASVTSEAPNTSTQGILFVRIYIVNS